MMNYIWAAMIVGGIICSFFTEKTSFLSEELMAGCEESIAFIISIAGVMALWTGLMNIAEKSGLIEILSQKIMPLMSMLFPEENNRNTIAIMLLSFAANLFGAGNSATVFSLKAMELLDEENDHSSYASNTMCMFIAVSTTMIQLVPLTVIKLRSDLGSSSPSDIILPSILSGLVSMAAAISICLICERRRSHAKRH